MNIRNHRAIRSAKTFRSASLLLAAATLAASVLAGCQSSSASSSATSSSAGPASSAASASSASTSSAKTALRIALFPNITHVQGLVGKDTGAFQKAVGDSVTITWNSYNAGPDETQAFLAGSEDIGYIGPGPAISANIQSHGDIQIIAGSTDAGELLVARKGVSIASVKDLAGKRVGVPQFGNTQHLTLLHLLQQNGLAPTTKGGKVEVVQANNADVQSLFEKNQLDAALVPEPWGTTLIKNAGAQVVLDEKTIWRDGKYATAVVIARKDFIQKHPDIVEAFLKAHVELTAQVNKDPQAAENSVNNQIYLLTHKKLSSDILSASFPRVLVVNDPAGDSVKDFYTISKDAGYIKDNATLSDVFDLAPLNKVLKEEGQPAVAAS